MEQKVRQGEEGFYFTITAGEVLLGAIAVLGMFFPAQLVAVFQNDPRWWRSERLRSASSLLALFFQPMTVCANMMFQSIGKNGRATLLAMLRSGLCFIPVLLLLSNTMGLTGVEVSQTSPIFYPSSFRCRLRFIFCVNWTREKKSVQKSEKIQHFPAVKRYL